jgi:hypothetical protein
MLYAGRPSRSDAPSRACVSAQKNFPGPSLPLTLLAPAPPPTPRPAPPAPVLRAATAAIPAATPVSVPRARPAAPDATPLLRRPPCSTTLTGAARARRSARPWRRSPLALPPATTATRRHPDEDGGGGRIRMRCMSQMYNSKRFRSLRGMLQALYIDVVKVDRDATHVVMDIHVCFKCISQIFHLF